MIKITVPDTIHSQIEIYLLRELTSQQKDHRIQLRQRLADFLSKNIAENHKQDLLDLNQLPKVPGYSISLSHCPVGSGFTIYKGDQYSLGFDMEQRSRIRQPVIERISGSEERRNCPDPSLLFCAKEASWKAVNRFGIQTIAEIETHSWKPVDSNWTEFQIGTPGKLIDGFGAVHLYSDTYLSFFITSSTFV